MCKICVKINEILSKFIRDEIISIQVFYPDENMLQYQVNNLPCVYVLCRDDEPLYVGSTLKCKQRLFYHFFSNSKTKSSLRIRLKKRGINLRDIVNRVVIIRLESFSFSKHENLKKLRKIEDVLMLTLKPRFNFS